MQSNVMVSNDRAPLSLECPIRGPLSASTQLQVQLVECFLRPLVSCRERSSVAVVVQLLPDEGFHVPGLGVRGGASLPVGLGSNLHGNLNTDLADPCERRVQPANSQVRVLHQVS